MGVGVACQRERLNPQFMVGLGRRETLSYKNPCAKLTYYAHYDKKREHYAFLASNELNWSCKIDSAAHASWIIAYTWSNDYLIHMLDLALWSHRKGKYLLKWRSSRFYLVNPGLEDVILGFLRE